MFRAKEIKKLVSHLVADLLQSLCAARSLVHGVVDHQAGGSGVLVVFAHLA